MLSPTRTNSLYAAIGIILLFCGCAKYKNEGFVSKPGLALTFDDSYVDEWYNCIPLFDSFGVKATFYISNYQTLSQDQKNKVKALQNHGHEIGYHSVHHPDFVKYAQKNKVGQLMEEEVNKGLALMAKDGFYPKTFAYPYGSHNEILDNCLLRQFKSVRALNGSTDYAKSLTPSDCNGILYAIGMDMSAGKTTEQLLDFVQVAKNNKNCLVLVGHHIQRQNDKMHVPYTRLKKIIKKAYSLGMQFYTASDISRK